jgi:hypothetical protein
MNFKEWLAKNETAGDSWGVPTAQPVARLYARYGGSAISGIMLPDSLPVDHMRQAAARADLERKLKKIQTKYKSSDNLENIYPAMEKQYQKLKSKLPRPQEFKDAPDQYTTAGWDSVGSNVDQDQASPAVFKALPMYR